MMVCGAVIVAVAVVLIALVRVEESKNFTRPHHVRTGGTNYVVQLLQATVGQTDSGCVVIVYARLENSNPFEIVLPRDGFVLAGPAGTRFLPAAGGTQPASLRVPASNALEQEMFSFSLPAASLRGSLGLKIGENDWVTIKSDKPFTRALRRGEFVSFRVRDW
jgi:hypothetical protein